MTRKSDHLITSEIAYWLYEDRRNHNVLTHNEAMDDWIYAEAQYRDAVERNADHLYVDTDSGQLVSFYTKGTVGGKQK